VGGGPSGSMTAAALAELGHDVLVIDKDRFPREKPCGDGLMHPAVAAAERMDLGDLIESRQEIEAARVVVSHLRQDLTRLVSAPGRPQPRCIVRSDFDAALLTAAQDRGARFLHARVDGLEAGDDRRLVAFADGEALAVRAGTIVAADGATSRIRRATSARPSRPMVYAVRQYFLSEQPLDPVFDFYVPLEVDGRVLSGYGWVFPIDLHTANIGVGFYRDARGGAPPLTHALSTFVAELRTKAAHRFGNLKEISEPFGSPLGIRGRIEGAGASGIVFAGDAAGTTHAVTGEGIAFAMRGGEAVARVVHAHLKRKGHASVAASAEAALWRPFPQLGVDISMLRRAWALEMNKGASGPTGSGSRPFLVAVKRMMGESAYETGAAETPAWRALKAHSPHLAECLERANDALLDSLSTRLPFVAEVIHRSTRSHLGPMYAAVTLAAASRDGPPLPDAVLEAAVAAETVAILPELLTMLVDRARSKTLRVNNAFAILTADFAATRALTAAAKLGAPAASALALACQQGCEGGMRDAETRFAPDRTVESWFRAAGETAGAAAIFATQLGAIVRGEPPTAADPLRQYAIELGIAIRLAEGIVDLTVGDDMQPGSEGGDLRRGIYSLPVLYAIEAERHLPRLLAQHTSEDGDCTEIIAAVRESGGLDRAVRECARRSEAARSLAQGMPGCAGETLAVLAAAPADYLASRASPDDQVTSLLNARAG
jgi:geranylgeranyl reductase family protein